MDDAVTCGASRFIHCLLIPVLAAIKSPTIVTSSEEAFSKISSMILPAECYLAAFDVTAPMMRALVFVYYFTNFLLHHENVLFSIPRISTKV